jgi:ABC-2 type transport system ATP-binding protein
VLLSSHILAQVEVLADRISIIRKGRVVETGTLAELRHLQRTTVVAEVGRPADALAGLPGVHGLRSDHGQVRFEVDGDQVDSVFRRLAELGVRSLVAHPPTLEQLLLRHYDDELGGEADDARVAG